MRWSQNKLRVRRWAAALTILALCINAIEKMELEFYLALYYSFFSLIAILAFKTSSIACSLLLSISTILPLMLYNPVLL
jgi:hypothetical protein